MEERIRLLSMVDIFEPLSFEEIENLNGHLPDRHLEQSEMLYIPEDSSERLFMLQKGKIRVFGTTPDGRELTLAIVESGTVFGEMSLTGQQLQGAYTQAMEPSEVSTMLRADLERLVLEKPEVGLKIMHLLSERLRRYETRLEDITMKDVQTRLASIIVMLVESEGVRTGTGYRIAAHYTHERLGTMIGTNREAVTRRKRAGRSIGRSCSRAGASRYCRGAGLWNAPSRGSRGTGGRAGTTSDCVPPVRRSST